MKIRKSVLLYLPFLLALCFWIGMYAFSFLQGDDYSFLVRGSGALKRIWDNYIYYYTYAGARMANLFAALLLLAELKIWRWLTPFVITGISLLLYYYVAGTCRTEGRPTCRDISLSCVCALFPGFIPVARHLFGDTFLWMDGSCNYLYPMLLALAGFVPFYCALRGWHMPRFFRYTAPVWFVAAGLLHEQVAMLLAVMSVLTVLYLHRERPRSIYLIVLTVLAVAVLIYMLTCPGAYYRLGTANADPTKESAQKMLSNLLIYLSPFGKEYWPWTAALGAVALCLLWRTNRRYPAKRNAFIFCFVGFGILLGPLSEALSLPTMQEKPFSGSKLSNLAEIALAAFWVLYFLAILYILLWCASSKHSPERGSNPFRYLSVLYIGMWASQAIPAVIGSTGRPMLPWVVLTLLITLCILHDMQFRWLWGMQFAAAGVAVCMMCTAIHAASENYDAYQRITVQVEAAKRGETNVVVFDSTQFQFDYAYYNAFSAAYERDLRKYFQLPKSITLQFKK